MWQSRSDANALYISARPEGGSWGTLGTIPLNMSGVSSSGVYRYGDIALAVPVPEARGVGSADYWQEQARVARQGEERALAMANLALDQRDAALREVASLRAQLASRPAQTQPTGDTRTCSQSGWTVERVRAHATDVWTHEQANGIYNSNLTGAIRRYMQNHGCPLDAWPQYR